MSAIPGAPEPCYIIHSRPYRERSLLLTLLSLAHGRVGAVCRASAKELSRMRALLRPFSPLECEFVRGRSELAVLRMARAAGPAAEIPAPAVFCAGYVNELVYWLYRDDEGSPQFFALYMNTIERLRKGDEAMALRDFETGLLSQLGYAPDFGQGGFDERARYSFIPGEGFAMAQDGDPDAVDGAALNAVAAGLTARPDARAALKAVNRAAIASLLNGRRLRSRDLYASYLKEAHDGQLLRPQKKVI